MNHSTLIFLLKEGHIDMKTRIEKGLWPHPPLRLKDCIIAIKSELDHNNFFPYPWTDKQNGEIIDDVAAIEKIDNKKFVFHYREANPINLKKIGLNETKVFTKPEGAAEYYLRRILRLPGDLDGWKVIK